MRGKMPQEQPPTIDNPKLSEWLTRMMILLNSILEGIYVWLEEHQLILDNGYELDSVREIIGRDDADQIPLGVDIPLQVTFGPAQVSASGHSEIRADGTLAGLGDETITYSAELEVSIGRVGNPQTSYILIWMEYNGTVFGNTNVVSLFNDDVYGIIRYTSLIDLAPGDEIKVFVARDSSGQNDGQLRSFTPALPGLSQTHSAIMELTRADVIRNED